MKEVSMSTEEEGKEEKVEGEPEPEPTPETEIEEAADELAAASKDQIVKEQERKARAARDMAAKA